MEAQPIKKDKKKLKSWFKSSKKNKETKGKVKKDKKVKLKKQQPNLNDDNNVSSSELCSTSTSIICSTEGATKIQESHDTEESKENDIYSFTNRKKLKDHDEDIPHENQDSNLNDKKDINKHDSFDKRIQQYYEPEDISKVKEAIKAIEAGELDKNVTKENSSHQLRINNNNNASENSVLSLSKRFNSNQSSNVNKIVDKKFGSLTEQKNSTLKIDKNINLSVVNSTKEKEYTIPLKVLKLEEYGNIKITKSTTYSQLREALISKCKINSFIFQDVSTKRPLLNESKKKVLQSTNNIIIAEKGADILLAESVLHGSKIFATKINGAFSFKVFWWDSHYHSNHQVWLKFEPGRITVSGVGGSFKLFDYKTLRVPLVFATVKGSERTFQFLRNKGSSLASRFYSINKEQRQAIAIYFCFVWRPQAVRRGWMPRLNSDPSFDNAGDVDDPVRFNNILKKHVSEINAIIKEIERRNDPNLVRKYLHLFQAMFGGGYTSVSDNDFEDMSGEGANLRKRIKDWRKLTNEKDEIIVEKKYSNEGSNRKVKDRSDEAEDDDMILVEFGDDEDLMFTTSNVSQVDSGPDITIVDGIPPPPPPVLGLNINKKPAILPVNYDAIFQKDIKGTIWADIDSLNLSKLTIEKLEKELTIIFGRDARDSGLDKKEEKSDTVLDSNRLRNLEILLKMDELKGLTMDDIIIGINNLDPRIFQLSVLERLVRKVGNGENSLHAFLPSDKEITTLMEHQNKKDSNIALTEGEKFLLEISKRVKYRVERLEYSFFILKWQDEYEIIITQLNQIKDAIDAVKNNDKIKKVLKVILEILTVLNPKNGNTKGFKISTFIPKVERVHGAVSNPLPKESEKEIVEEKEEKNLSKEEIKRAKLEKLRKKKKKEEDAEGWKVLLLEYLAIYITKFKECRYFWKDLIEPCEIASSIDILLLDKQCTSWSSQLASMNNFLENNDLSDDDPLIIKLKDFLRSKDKIDKLIEDVSKTRTETENLWHYFGEEVSSEPQVIFKYICEFSKVIEKYFNLVKSSKEIKIKILKGQLPLIPHKPKPKKKEKMAKKEKSKNSKIDEIRARLETRNRDEEAGGEVNEIEDDNKVNNDV